MRDPIVPVRRLMLAATLLAVLSSACGTPQSAVGAAGQSTPIRGAALLTPNVGWVLTDGRLAKTGDAGATWQDITPPTVAAASIAAVAFSDATRGWIITRGPSAQLLRTPDGGASWTPGSLPTTPGLAIALTFADSAHGWLLNTTSANANFSKAELWSTADGGSTWQPRSAPSTGAIRFVGASDGFLAYRDALFVTRDGGVNWQRQTVPLPPPWQSAIPAYELPVFADPLFAVMTVGFTNLDAAGVGFYVSRDGGASWQLAFAEHLTKSLAAYTKIPLALADGNSWLALAPGGGDVVATADGGTTHARHAPVGLPEGVEGVSARGPIAWALSHWQSCTGPKAQIACVESWQLSKSVNRGQTWTALTP